MTEHEGKKSSSDRVLFLRSCNREERKAVRLERKERASRFDTTESERKRQIKARRNRSSVTERRRRRR